MKYERIIRAAASTPWAIQPEKLDAIVEFLTIKADGGQIEYQAAAGPAASRAGSVAVIPVYGVVSHRMNMMQAMSGGTSTEMLRRDVRAAMVDPDISAVLLDFDTPGGSVYGVQELADELYSMRGDKPLVAFANPLAASAGYWLASSVDELYITPSGDVGSVGVIAMHVDQSAANEQDGLKVEYITAGQYKAEGNPHEPLSDSAREYMQARVDAYYEQFVGALARNRGVSPDLVREAYGQGRVLGASDALAAGMIDGIQTFDQTVTMLRERTQRRGAPARNRAKLALATF